MRSLLALALLCAAPAMARVISKPVGYTLGDVAYEGVLVYDDASKAKRPGLVLVPNWLGVTPANVKQAEEVAGTRYVVFVADMYGKGKAPKSMEEAGKAAGALKADRKAMRERVNRALAELLAHGAHAPLDAGRVGAIGFCFGGTSVLELARSGASVSGVVSFHGGLSSPTPADAKAISGKVLALHGADDPTVPRDEVKAFEDEMRAAKVDWQLVAFGNAVHSFTDPDAKMPGRAEYNPKVARRAYQMMNAFFAEAFGL